MIVELMLSQDIPPSDPIDQDDDGAWDTVGAAAERNIIPPPATEEVVPGAARQEIGVVNSQASAEEARDTTLAATVEQPEGTSAEVKETSEDGIVEISSTPGAPTVTVVRSTL
jgi:hypothetical protein